MIIISIITLIISFFLQGITSNYLNLIPTSSLSWFITIYPLVNVLILTPYFENNKKNIIIVIITGLLVDMIFTNTFVLNAMLFTIIYYISSSFHFFFPYNLFTLCISNVLSISAYHILSFLILTLLRYDHYSLLTLANILTHSIIMTIIYSSIIYLILDKINTKLELKAIK